MKAISIPLHSRPPAPAPDEAAVSRKSRRHALRPPLRGAGIPAVNRLWVVSTVHQPDDVRIFWKQSVTLAAAGYEVTALFFTSDPAQVRDESLSGVRRLVIARERVPLLPGSRLSPPLQALRLCLASGVENFILHDPELIPMGLILERMGRTVIYDAHEDLPTQTLHKTHLSPWKRHLARSCAQVLFASAKRGLSGRLCATRTIQDCFPKRSCLVRNFPLLSEFEVLPVDRRGRQVVYVGGLSRARGILELIQAVNLLAEPVTLVLAGPWEGDIFRSECEKADLHGRVTYAGTLNRRNVAQLLAQSDIGVVVLHDTPAYVDALPVKLFEYMAAGLPVIASDFPLWRSIVAGAGCGVLVEPENAESLRIALAYLLENPEIRTHMGTNGRTAVERRYTWEAESTAFLSFVESLFGAPTPPPLDTDVALPA